MTKLVLFNNFVLYILALHVVLVICLVSQHPKNMSCISILRVSFVYGHGCLVDVNQNSA